MVMGKLIFSFSLFHSSTLRNHGKRDRNLLLQGSNVFKHIANFVVVRSCEMIIVFLWSNFSILPFIEIFTENQTYVIFETNNGGQDLEKFKLKTVKEAVSILKQVRKYAAADYITSNFLKAVFHKFYWVHSGILYPRCEVVLLIKILKKFDVWNQVFLKLYCHFIYEEQ